MVRETGTLKLPQTFFSVPAYGNNEFNCAIFSELLACKGLK